MSQLQYPKQVQDANEHSRYPGPVCHPSGPIFPVKFHLFLELPGDNLQMWVKMLPQQSVEMIRIAKTRGTVPHREVTITD